MWYIVQLITYETTHGNAQERFLKVTTELPAPTISGGRRENWSEDKGGIHVLLPMYIFNV